MKEKLIYYYNTIKSSIKFSKYHSNKGNNKLSAELIRYTHSIEKGLSINNIKPGFGHKKQYEMMKIIEKLELCNNDYYNEIIDMALSALDKYIKYHDNINFSDNTILLLKEFIKKREAKIDPEYGGTIELNFDNLKIDLGEVEKLFNTRHSIRNFTAKPVDNNTIKKAIELAQKAPSACNRQGVRTYIIDKKRIKKIIEHLNGIGGFADTLDKLIIITGKISSYRYNEINQYIVSASIYAGYLSLTLHAYGLGACIIQRPVVWNKAGEKIKKDFMIEADEQIICMIGVGNVDGKIFVPVSHRIEIEKFAKFIE